MTLEKEKTNIIELEPEINFREWLIKALSPSKLVKHLLDQNQKELRNLTLDEAIRTLHHPESSSLHITQIIDCLDFVPQPIIMEPLTHFGKKDKELLNLVLAKEGKYSLQLFDNKNVLFWSETFFSKSSN